MINGKNYGNDRRHSCCYYSNGERLRRNKIKYTLMHGHGKVKLI